MYNNDSSDEPQPLSLAQMAIGSVDTLRGTEPSLHIPPDWNERPPLLRGPPNRGRYYGVVGGGGGQQRPYTEETPVLLKAVRT